MCVCWGSARKSWDSGEAPLRRLSTGLLQLSELKFSPFGFMSNI